MKINLDNATFQPGTTRWPWPTFHHDNARTGCNTTTTPTMVSASVIGKSGQQRRWRAWCKLSNIDTLDWVAPELLGWPTDPARTGFIRCTLPGTLWRMMRSMNVVFRDYELPVGAGVQVQMNIPQERLL